MLGRWPSHGGLDGKDLKILEALQVNARAPLAELGPLIELSQPAISERVKRLEGAGVIEGYGPRINPRALGLGFMRLFAYEPRLWPPTDVDKSRRENS